LSLSFCVTLPSPDYGLGNDIIKIRYGCRLVLLLKSKLREPKKNLYSLGV